MLSKFKYYCCRKGFLYAVYRGVIYIVFCIKSGDFSRIFSGNLKSKKKERREPLEVKLELGNLRVVINSIKTSLDIYWSNIKLTEALGVISVIGDHTYSRHYSNQALWNIEQHSSASATVTLEWGEFPVAQLWKIELTDEKNIRLDIRITSFRKLALAEQEVGLMLSSDYTRWVNSYEQGEFSKIEYAQNDWKEMKVWNVGSKSLGVRSCGGSWGTKPALILDYENTKEDTEPKIRNSDYNANLRALLVQVLAGNPLKIYDHNKAYNIFSGKIRIVEEEKQIEEYINICKEKLYRQRVHYIEEKMPRKYLSEILSPLEVLLVNLPWKMNGSWGVRAGSRWPHIKNKGEEMYLPFPFFMAYSASIFLKHRINARIIDAIAERLENDNFIDLVNEINPRFLIAEVSTPSLMNDVSILKRINKKNTKIAICGLDSNISNPAFLKENDFIDFAMIGEYEFTALELYKHIKNSRKLSEVPGIIYREDGGAIRINPSGVLNEDLDNLPWPLREQLPMEQYVDAPGNIPFPSVQMIASRGCPFKCNFCAWPQLIYNSTKYRMRKAKAIIDEMEYLVKERKFKSIYFDDDTFNINKKNVLEICKEIKERDLVIPWAIMARADMMDEEMLRNLKEAGLSAVKYGVESSAQKLLDGINKKMDLKRAERMIRFTKSLGIKTHLTFTFGLPGETKETIKRTIDYAVKLNPFSAQFSILTPYPGTEYYRELDSKGHIISKDWSHYDGSSKSVIRTEFLLPRDLEKAKDEACRIWNRHTRRRFFITLPFDSESRKIIRDRLKFNGWLYAIKKILGYARNSLKIDKFLPKKIKFPDMAGLARSGLEIIGIFDGEYAYKGPDCVQIDLTNNCNNDCVACWCNSPLLGDKAIPADIKKQSLDYKLVIKLIDKLSAMRTRELFFSGGGEPLMHPRFIDIISYAKLKGFVCHLNTNFTLADANIIKKLKDVSLDYLIVSLWSATPRTYLLTHPNKDEETFIRIKNLLKLLNESKRIYPKIRLYNVISNINYREFIQMVDFALDTKCEFVEFTVVDTIPGRTDKLLLSKKQNLELIEMCKTVKEDKKYYTANGEFIIVNFEQFLRRISCGHGCDAEYDREFLDDVPCYVGWLFARVLADGNVNSCLKSHRIPIGNLYKDEFDIIWNGKLQCQFRKSVLGPKNASSIFSLIGNDPGKEIGCYKSCDDLGRNLFVHEKILGLNSCEKLFLQSIAGVKQFQRKLLRNGK